MTIEEVLAKEEKQVFDRKSVQIKPVDLADTLCAFANADGGMVAIGISDKKRRSEGVDRMCRELEAIGLPDPLFNNDYFILKTTVMSSAYEKSAVDKEEMGGSSEKSAVQGQKVGGSPEKSAVQMIDFSAIESRCVAQGYSRPTVNSIRLLYDKALPLPLLYPIQMISRYCCRNKMREANCESARLITSGSGDTFVSCNSFEPRESEPSVQAPVLRRSKFVFAWVPCRKYGR